MDGTTLTIASTDFGAQGIGVAVRQANSLAVGTLLTALNGSTTTIVVTSTNGTFDATNAITVGTHATTPVPTVVDDLNGMKGEDKGWWVYVLCGAVCSAV